MSERLDEAGLKAATEAMKPRGYGWPRTPELQAKWVVRAYLDALPVDEGAVLLRATVLYPGSRVSDLSIGGHKVQVPNAALRAALSAHTDHSPPEGEG